MSYLKQVWHFIVTECIRCNLHNLLHEKIMKRYSHSISLSLLNHWPFCCFYVGRTCIHKWEWVHWKDRGGTRLESRSPSGASTTLHSIRKALNGFQWGNCSGRTEQIDGYTFCMLLLVGQQHQKHLIDNYSRESRERDKARGDDAFQEDIRFG